MNNKIFLYLIIGLLIISCNKKQNHIQKQNPSNDSSFANINDYMRFIAGLDDKKFSDIQQKDFYKNYSKSISTTWNYFYIKQLMTITQWTVNNGITNIKDTVTVFYPFSGPDLPFVLAFFPYANNYLLVGLENIGSIPDLTKYTDLQTEKYLSSLSMALNGYLHNGYFVTERMKKNFRHKEMNGIVHPLLFFIARTGYKVDNFSYFEIDSYGRPQFKKQLSPTSGNIKGVKIDISSNAKIKHIYYVQFDLSDKNFCDNPQFSAFVSRFNEKNVFIKSASYLLQMSDFKIFKHFLINQAVKILQDDSGFDFAYMKKNNFNIKLFGNYKQTLKIFKDFYQPDLKAEFDKQHTQKLPFRFGYNIPFEATCVIFANKSASATKYPYYTIQFKMLSKKVKTDTFHLDIQPVTYYFDEGYYKYTAGHFLSEDSAQDALELIKNQGFTDAFILKVDNFSKIPLN